jgi:hypothetical protein
MSPANRTCLLLYGAYVHSYVHQPDAYVHIHVCSYIFRTFYHSFSRCTLYLNAFIHALQNAFYPKTPLIATIAVQQKPQVPAELLSSVPPSIIQQHSIQSHPLYTYSQGLPWLSVTSLETSKILALTSFLSTFALRYM